MKNKLRLIISLIAFSIFLFTTIGYAAYGFKLRVNGSAKFLGGGTVHISNVVLDSYSNLDNPGSPSFTDDSIDFNLNFTVQNNSALDDDYKAEYTVTITNASFYDYAFASTTFTPSVQTTNNQNMNVSFEVEGIDIGEIIPSKTTKSFTVIISMYPKAPGEYNVSGSSDVDLNEEEEEPTGSLLASIAKNITLDLRNQQRDMVTVNVINSYDSAQTFSLSLNNSNFLIVDQNGNNLGSLTIPANTTQSFNIYIQKKNGVEFATDSQNVNLIFTKTDGNTNLGSIKILVPKNETLLDDDPPVISNVSAAFVAQNGRVNLSWNCTDLSGADHFIIEAFDNNDNLVQTYTTSNNDTNYQVTGLSNGTYYFKVYGVDIRNNNGKTQATTCTTSSGICSRSTSSEYTWVFTVTYNLTNLSSGNSSTSATIGTSYTGRITASGNYNLPNSITITMNGQRLTSGYTYSNNNGNITINNVTGPITIQATATGGGICLVKGTKIKLANGKYKKIEDIKYTDLLSVWSYETGSLTYEYPIWIEKSNESKSYQKTTFSDGTVLKTVGLHQVFSMDDNKFVNIYDDENGFVKIGTKVAKEVEGKIVPIKVVKVETINEKIKYYYVASSIYYNVISENIITTSDQIVPGVTLSNMYGFDNNIKWPPLRKKIISEKGALYDYKDLSIMPYYLYYGSRGNETKLFVNLGYATTPQLIDYLLRTQLNPDKVVNPITDKKGNRLWMVTTGDDVVKNTKDYLYKEGDIYTLKEPKNKTKNFIGWFNTVDNKLYQPGDKYKVIHGTHFIQK